MEGQANPPTDQSQEPHFVGYLWFVRQFGASQVDFPTVGAFLWPQLPLAVPVGLLTAALNQAGRPRQAIDPAEVKRMQREAAMRMTAAVRRAGNVRDDHWQVPALGPPCQRLVRQLPGRNR
jgi:hypothetical protein